MKIIKYNGENIDALIKEGLVILDFYADWCGPCKMLGVSFEELGQENLDLTIIKIDTDVYSDLAAKYGIMTIPNVYVYKNGEQVNHFIGYKDKEEIKELLR